MLINKHFGRKNKTDFQRFFLNFVIFFQYLIVNYTRESDYTRPESESSFLSQPKTSPDPDNNKKKIFCWSEIRPEHDALQTEIDPKPEMKEN